MPKNKPKKNKAWALVTDDESLVLYDWYGIPAIFATKREAEKWTKASDTKVRACEIILK